MVAHAVRRARLRAWGARKAECPFCRRWKRRWSCSSAAGASVVYARLGEGPQSSLGARSPAAAACLGNILTLPHSVAVVVRHRKNINSISNLSAGTLLAALQHG